jgi:Arc/MetJ-type ribon-helix-helix transcriptional regulator
MSKITFRADDNLVERLEAFDASKSEVMREALRAYLDDRERASDVDGAIAERVDELVAERLDARAGSRPGRDVNVNITLDRVSDGIARSDARHTTTAGPRSEPETRGTARETSVDDRKTSAPSEGRTSDEEGAASQPDRKQCGQCGENVGAGHVYCPNCGEKTSRRVFCDCGDELRSDWSFCPSCGRRTPAADVLDRS